MTRKRQDSKAELEPEPEPEPKPKPRSDRLVIVNETKMKCIEHDILNDPATKVLFKILDNYHEKGLPCHIELPMKLRYDRPRKYVVDLHNQAGKLDTVLIRAMTEEEEEESQRTMRRAQPPAGPVMPKIKRNMASERPDSGSGSGSGSESDDEPPELVDA